jgi:hypothetical protein
MRNSVFLFDSSSEPQRNFWTLSRRHRVAAAVMGFAIVLLVPVVVLSTSNPNASRAPEMACNTIDWRVGEKLAALQDRDDSRTRAIVNSMTRQRETARAHCRAGLIDDAMALYGLTDRALTRYVSYGTGPNLPKAQP